MLIGAKTAENAKFILTNVFDPTGKVKTNIRGRHMLTGLPAEIEITDMDIYEAIHDMTEDFVTAVKDVLEQTPPELVGDIHTKGSGEYKYSVNSVSGDLTVRSCY